MDNRTVEKNNLINDYLTNYDEGNMIGFCNIALNKYRFEKYKIRNLNRDKIDEDDYIVNRNHPVFNLMTQRVDEESCTPDQFRNILENLEIEQLYYIGF